MLPMNVTKTNAIELYNINLLSQNPNLEACCSNQPATYSSVHCILIGGIYKKNMPKYQTQKLHSWTPKYRKARDSTETPSLMCKRITNSDLSIYEFLFVSSIRRKESIHKRVRLRFRV